MLENWKQYIHKDDFDKLVNFVENTKNGIKEKTVCVIYGPRKTGKSTFANQLRENIGVMNVHHKQIGFLKRPSTGMGAKLIIVDNPEHYEFDDCVPHIKEYLSDTIIYRRPYTIQTKANIMIVSSDENFFDDFTQSTKNIFTVIRFVHEFT
jgi:hypothetical protein